MTSSRHHAVAPLIAIALWLPALTACQNTKAPEVIEIAQDGAPSGVEDQLRGINATLDALYESVSFGPGGECDWERIETLMMEGVVFVQPPARGAERKVMDLDGFFADFRSFIANSSVKETGFQEQITSRRTDLFGDVAHSYVIFEVRTDPDSPSPISRGLDSIQLIKMGERWVVSSITTAFERPGRPMPQRFL